MTEVRISAQDGHGSHLEEITMVTEWGGPSLSGE